MINNLPIEIQDNIWNLYWMDIFTNNIIVFLKKITSKIDRIIEFTDLYFLPSQEKSEMFDHIFIDFLVASNDIFYNIERDKGLKIFIKNKFKDVKFVLIEKSYINDDKRILKKIQYIALFMISRSGQMRYYTYDRFVKLSNKFKNIEL